MSPSQIAVPRACCGARQGERLIRIKTRPDRLGTYSLAGRQPSQSQGDTMPVRTALKFFVLGFAVFGVAIAARRMFFWDIKPVSWEQDTQPVWALETAFLLRSIENLGLAVAVIMLAVALGFWINRRWRRETR
jgi:hypothetical protein